jgi:hypothetical protein
MTEKQLRELLEKFAPIVRDAILNGLREIRDSAILAELIRMIERGDEQGVLRALGYNPAVFSGYYVAMLQTFEAGGLALIAGLPKYATARDGVRTVMRFNVRDREAEAWLQERSSGLVTEIGEDVRQSVRTSLQRGLAEGRNPRNIALDLVGRVNRETGRREGGAVGLTTGQIGWAQSARQKLLTLDPGYFDMGLRDKRFDSVVRKAIEENRPLPLETVERLITRYEDNALKHRGETIGRSEALAALNRSEFEATRQALLQSDLPLAAAEKVWDSAGDSRVRHSHAEMDGQRVGIDEPFVSPVTGARMMHPHDTSLGAPPREVVLCRCRVRYVIDFAHGVA